MIVLDMIANIDMQILYEFAGKSTSRDDNKNTYVDS